MTTKSSNEMAIGQITKQSGIIKVAVKEFNGREFVDIRECFTAKDGTICPTKRGVTLPPEKIGELVTLVSRVEELYLQSTQEAK